VGHSPTGTLPRSLVSHAQFWKADDPSASPPESDSRQKIAEPTPTIRQIIEGYSSQVWRALRYCGVAPADLHDACQDVFLVIHRKLHEFEHRSSMNTWVYGICLRVASSYRRAAHRRHEQVVAETPELPVLPTQLQEVEDHRARQRLLAALDKLDADKRQVFVLFEIEDRPMADIAAMLGCPLRTVYSRLEAARRDMAREWQHQELRRGSR
jgi:RNA polymerase sigma-70 factor, ECF subfamily